MIMGLLNNKKSQKLLVLGIFCAGLQVHRLQGSTGIGGVDYLERIIQPRTSPTVTNAPLSVPTPPITPAPSEHQNIVTSLPESDTTDVVQSSSNAASSPWYQSLISSVQQRLSPTEQAAGAGILGYASYLWIFSKRISRLQLSYAPIIELFKYPDAKGDSAVWHDVPSNPSDLYRQIGKYGTVYFFMENLEKDISSLTLGSWISISPSIGKGASDLKKTLTKLQEKMNYLSYEALQDKMNALGVKHKEFFQKMLPPQQTQTRKK